ncbi:MAG: hypothetical protein MK137_09570 [Rickettsiales bacterium]|nr:hypothetical protein [Rickettsiales bacterium]
MSALSAKFKEQVLGTFSYLTYLGTAAGAIAAAFLLTPLAAGAILVGGITVGGIAQISSFKYRNEGEIKETAEGTAKGNRELVKILESQQEKLSQINEKLSRIESHTQRVSERKQEGFRGIG